jgi:D-sedoheptulose 7-phosphate isomerase
MSLPLQTVAENYLKTLRSAIDDVPLDRILTLASWILESWRNGRCLYFCGNGGSAGNAIHLANDFLFGAGRSLGVGVRVEALSANPAVITCLANDIGYDQIFSEQIRVKGSKEDVLIVLSGSGNSDNVINALHVANDLGLKTCAILGYRGGECKSLAHLPIHIPVNDMQVSEDMQLIIGHICMQWLSKLSSPELQKDII